MSILYKKFSTVNLTDPFFDSLKADYPAFPEWFLAKSAAGESAFVFTGNTGVLSGFLYLKVEDGPVNDVVPSLAAARRVKLGTLKIDAHGTKLGERFIKKSLDWAIENGAFELYVTVLPKHKPLIALLERYGFVQKAKKGDEKVLVKSIGAISADLDKNYPAISLPASAYLLSIYPMWHTRLFPDSKLLTEGPALIEDVSHTNSIHKVYLCKMGDVETLKAGDILVIYRTKEDGKSAEYSSVATSICVVEEYRHISSFASEEDFISYAAPFSVFTNEELHKLWIKKDYPKIIRFTYNFSFKKRPIRQKLADEVGLSRDGYWGFMPLTEGQLKKIANLGGLNEGLIVNKA